MAFTNPAFEQRRLQIIGGKTPSPSTTSTIKVSGGFSDPAFEKRRLEISKPITKPTQKAKTTSFFENTNSIVKIKNTEDTSIMGKLKRQGEIFKTGLKNIPESAKITGGILLKELSNLNKVIYNEELLKKIPGGNKYIKARETQSKEGGKLIEKGMVGLDKVAQERAKLGTREGLEGFADLVSYNAPSTVASVGIGLVATAVTANPAIGTALGLSAGFSQTVGETYADAKRNKADEKTAQNVSLAAGTIVGAIEALPLGRLLTKSPSGQIIKKSLIKNISRLMVSASIQSGIEGVTEGIQQIVQNALALTYDENRNLFEGLKESISVGAFLGAASDITVEGLNSTLQITEDGKSIENVLKEVKDAVETEPSNRTEQQQIIASALESNTMTPDEAIAQVIDSDLENTETGKQIILSAMEAKQKGTNVQIQYDRVSPVNEELDSLSETARTYKSVEEFIADHAYKEMDGLSKEKSIKEKQLTDIYNKAQGVQEVPKAQLPTGEGKEKVSRLESRMKGIFDTASEEQIKQFGLSTYQQMNKKETIGNAAEFVTNNPDEALQILSGEKEAPNGIPPEAIYVAMLESIPEVQNSKQLTLATKLASLQATAIGQRISLLTEIDKDSPVKLLNDIYKIREAEVTKKFGKKMKEAKKTVKEEVKKKIKVDKYDWNDFINSIEC